MSSNSDVRIVVLQRGWVIVGLYDRQGEYVNVTKAAVVRCWGTESGLGELADKGPRPRTILDPTPKVEFHVLAEVFNIKCNYEKWTKYLASRT